jgi:hypothetical protein
MELEDALDASDFKWLRELVFNPNPIEGNPGSPQPFQHPSPLYPRLRGGRIMRRYLNE